MNDRTYASLATKEGFRSDLFAYTYDKNKMTIWKGSSGYLYLDLSDEDGYFRQMNICSTTSEEQEQLLSICSGSSLRRMERKGRFGNFRVLNTLLEPEEVDIPLSFSTRLYVSTILIDLFAWVGENTRDFWSFHLSEYRLVFFFETKEDAVMFRLMM